MFVNKLLAMVLLYLFHKGKVYLIADKNIRDKICFYGNPGLYS